MKKYIALFLAAMILTGCAPKNTPEGSLAEAIPPESESTPVSEASAPEIVQTPEIPYVSCFDGETKIHLSDDSVLITPPEGHTGEAPAFVSRDIIYYEDRDSYDSGNPYGEGEDWEKHTQEEAEGHTVVNITQPGAYRISGSLSAGQIRVDLGEEAKENPEAVVELILEDADITCTVAPVILFRNVYECDGGWSVEEAQAEVDTTAAGANLILEGSNTVSGSHVAKVFKDQAEEKKLWKQDGAVYSYQSMNVFGPGSLEITADNEGLDSELHLTINGGSIEIFADNDGINTNEDGVSVTTVNGGALTIFAGLGEEGDGIDSNGYLVINGGSVVAMANPAADAGLDADLGSFVNGGTVIAMGSAMEWAESDSRQVTMNLQFAGQQKAGSKIRITKEDGTELFSFESHSEYARNFSGLILSHPGFTQGETYHVYIDDRQMSYTDTDVGRGGPGGFSGQMPGGMEFPEGEMPEMPEGMQPGERPELPEGETMPENFAPGQWEDRQQGGKENGRMPGGFDAEAPAMPENGGREIPEGGFGGAAPQDTSGSTSFYMNDKVNAFSGVTQAA